MDYEVLVVGAGAAGMEAALTLGDMGHRVLLVEKEPSIGGRMILLSKVFPTLDCASCISTPKMAATSHHPNVTTMVYSEVENIVRKDDGSFDVEVLKKATFVDPNRCTGCQECEFACTVANPDKFNDDLVAHRAAFIPFPQAIPKKAVIERRGTSPCSFECPGGVKAHGYVSLVRSGKIDEAFNLHLEDIPIPGSLGRVCYAPCEGQCTRGQVEGPVAIRGIKRFFADKYYSEHPEPEYGVPEERKGGKVAIVGSGPAGLTAAYHLALQGYRVKIFEAAPKAGGMLRLGIPSYRLPKDVVDRDILNITALGVEIETNHRVESLSGLKDDGFDAIFVATGALDARKIRIPGEDLDGVTDCMTFLRDVNLGNAPDLTGKKVVVIGGGNAAIDPARVALRLGAAEVSIQYRRSRSEMPAHKWEVDAAEAEGVHLRLLENPVRFIGDDSGHVVGIDAVSMELGEPDESGRRRPIPVEGSEHRVDADLVILSIGLSPSSSPFKELELNRNGTIVTDPNTLQTSVPYVFAGGDVATGPSMVIEAAGQGKLAAKAIARFLEGELTGEPLLEHRPDRADPEEVLSRYESLEDVPRRQLRELDPATRAKGFDEVEQAFTEEEAREEAGRCLDCGVCSECHQCIHACPADAIDLSMQDQRMELNVGSVILATGVNLFDAKNIPRLGYGKYPNVITSMQMERILAPTRPYNNVLRPSDGKVPDNIAYVLCVGSRDQSVGNPLCSRVCCMYSLKHAQLLMGAVPLADITIYYIDIRAFGKGYEEFRQQAEAMGTLLVKGKVAEIEEGEDGNLILTYEDMENGHKIERMEHDLVVLSVGLLPNQDPLRLFGVNQLEADDFKYVREVDEDLQPARTSIPGVFVAGAASAAKDIPDTIVHAGAAAMQAAIYLQKTRARQ